MEKKKVNTASFFCHDNVSGTTRKEKLYFDINTRFMMYISVV